MATGAESGRVVLRFCDDTVEAFVEQGSFRGRAASDHPLLANELAAFAKRLALFPLAPTEVKFSGEGWIGFYIQQIDELGHIELRVTVGTFFPESSAMITLRSDYETVAKFAHDLGRLADQTVGEIVVCGIPSGQS